jgi:phage/plasmid primase-like uncharacterized protein
MANIIDMLGQAFTPPEVVPQHQKPAELQLAEAIASYGMIPPDDIRLDGCIHRFSASGKKSDDAGWYVAFNDKIPAGQFGNWRDGSAHNWRADVGRDITAIEQIAHARRIAEAKAARERAQEAQKQAASDTADTIWANATPASDDHPYLVKKGIAAHGLRVTGDGRLIAPMMSPDGSVASLQFIAADGDKRFLSGGAVKGASWMVGAWLDTGAVYIAEGVATAASIHAATNQPCVVAFSAGNLPAVAAFLRSIAGQARELVIVADNDESGTGEREGRKAAAESGARFVMPPMLGDANDFVQGGGDLAALLSPPVDDWLIAADDFCAQPSPIKWLIKGHLQQEALIMVHGPSGGGKTFAVLDMCLSIASGKDAWCGHKVKRGAVVYLAGEGHHGLRGRVAAWKQHHNAGKLNMWLSKAGTDLNTVQGYAKVRDSVNALPAKPCLIVVDTLHRFLLGDENSAQDAKTMLDACGNLMQEFGASVLLVHHTGVSDEAQHRARGSSAWRGALDIELSVIPAKDGAPMQLVQRKSKDAELAAPIYCRLASVPIAGWFDEDGEQVTSAVAVQVEADECLSKSDTPPKRVLEAKKRFEDACIALGDIKGGGVYLSASAWLHHAKEVAGDSKTDATVRKDVSRDKKTLLDEGLISEFEQGFLCSDPVVLLIRSSALK